MNPHWLKWISAGTEVDPYSLKWLRIHWSESVFTEVNPHSLTWIRILYWSESAFTEVTLGGDWCESVFHWSESGISLKWIRLSLKWIRISLKWIRIHWSASGHLLTHIYWSDAKKYRRHIILTRTAFHSINPHVGLHHMRPVPNWSLSGDCTFWSVSCSIVNCKSSIRKHQHHSPPPHYSGIRLSENWVTMYGVRGRDFSPSGRGSRHCFRAVRAGAFDKMCLLVLIN